MANQWFKFYGPEYLSDQKMLALSAVRRSCWITLLSYASLACGEVRYLNEDQLMMQSGVDPLRDEWQETKGVLEQFKNLGMIRIDNGVITVLNWQKRQYTCLTPYERVKRYREKKRDDNGSDNAMITLEKNRIEKNRKEREKKPTASIYFLQKIPSQDLQELSEKYKIAPKGIQSKATDLKLYCESKGRVYKNYRAFLENALRKDQFKLRQDYPLPKPVKPEAPEKPETPEERERREKKMAEIREGMRGVAKAKTI